MDIALVIFGPMVLCFVVLAALPPDIRYVVALGIVLCICAAIALAPLPPSSGPDDWFRGIGRLGGQLGLVGSVATIPAQAARRFVPLGIAPYALALIASAAAGFFLVTIFG